MNRFSSFLWASALLCLMGLTACNKTTGEQSARAIESIPAAGSANENVQLQAIGMHCDNCVQSIQGTVAKMEGVESVNADFKSGVVNVSFNPGKVSEQQIAAEIESLGFSVPGRVGSPEAEAALAEKAAADQAAQQSGAESGNEDAAAADDSATDEADTEDGTGADAAPGSHG